MVFHKPMDEPYPLGSRSFCRGRPAPDNQGGNMRKVSRPLGLCFLVATLIIAGVVAGAVGGLFSSSAASKATPLALAKQSDRDIPGTGEANGAEGPASASTE